MLPRFGMLRPPQSLRLHPVVGGSTVSLSRLTARKTLRTAKILTGSPWKSLLKGNPNLHQLPRSSMLQITCWHDTLVQCTDVAYLGKRRSPQTFLALRRRQLHFCGCRTAVSRRHISSSPTRWNHSLTLYIHIYIHMCTHTYMHVFICIIYTYTDIDTYTYICICVYRHMLEHLELDARLLGLGGLPPTNSETPRGQTSEEGPALPSEGLPGDPADDNLCTP